MSGQYYSRIVSGRKDTIEYACLHHVSPHSLFKPLHSLVISTIISITISMKANVENSAKDCKLLNKIADRVANIEPLKLWLNERPKTMF